MPSFIRQKIELRSTEKILVLSPHSKLKCITGYDTNYSATLQAVAEKRLGDNPDPFAELEMQAALFGSTLDISYDTSGRIILPNSLKRHSQIKDAALFIGMMGEFHIWNPEVAAECEVEAIRRIAANHLQDRSAA